MSGTKTFFFCGIGGSGMNPLAQVLLQRGDRVRGSDRNRDRGLNPELYVHLADQGVVFYPQDGSGVDEEVDTLVVSSAVEETIPDVQAALRHGIPIRKRTEILAALFNQSTGIAVGGTSGKTTVTGMIGHILQASGQQPTVINGGVMLNAAVPPYLGNAICGRPDLLVIEADESDGTIVLYDPAVAVLTNISLDHKPISELEPLFADFCNRASQTAVVNQDCAVSVALTTGLRSRVTFGVENPAAAVCATGVTSLADGMAFQIEGVPVRIRVPGRHNVSNAAAAVAACRVFGVPVEDAAAALAGFLGIRRRLQVVGQASGVTVMDDFAHNPDKIAASLAALKAHPGRLLLVFQPHGFGPTRFLKDGLVAAFGEGMDGDDWLVMPEIYYAGGTAQKDISSGDLIAEIAAQDRRATFIPDRETIVDAVGLEAKAGDRVVVMGARDDTLTPFAEAILDRIRNRHVDG